MTRGQEKSQASERIHGVGRGDVCMRACNANPWEVETAGSGVQWRSQLHSEFGTCLGSMRPHLEGWESGREE